MDNQELRGIVVGMILGDGSLNMPNPKSKNGENNHGKSKNCRLAISHVDKCRDYLDWKGAILKQLTDVRYDEFKGGYTDHNFVRVTTKCHPFYTRIWERSYYNGKRSFDDFILNSLNEQGLAIWYMDDGSLHFAKSGEGHIACVELSSNAYNYAEHLMLQKMMWNKFGLSTTIQKKTKYYKLYIRRKYVDRFMEIVSPYVSQVPSMLYKIRTEKSPCDKIQSALIGNNEMQAEMTCSN